jgi:hypothetical protein
MKRELRNLVNYFELPAEWQIEAQSNNDETYEDEIYIEPLKHHIPKQHILFDLAECMRCDNSQYDGVIGISNTMAIGVKLISDTECELFYL